MIDRLRFQIRKRMQSSFARFGYELRRRRVVTVRGLPENPHQVQQVLLEASGVNAPVIFDIGANQGQSVIAYRKAFRKSTIHCFEPFPDARSRLEQRYDRHPDVHIHALAVSDRSGRETFHLNKHIQTHSLLPRPRQGRRYYPRVAGPTGIEIEVACTTIDDFIRDQGLGQVDIVKLDIQGGEMRALKGAHRTLSQLHPAMIFTEAAFIPHYEGEGLFHELWILLESYGYSLYDLFEMNRASNGQLRYANALFVSRELRDQVVDRFPSEP